jgi:hypothetical protein
LINDILALAVRQWVIGLSAGRLVAFRIPSAGYPAFTLSQTCYE